MTAKQLSSKEARRRKIVRDSVMDYFGEDDKNPQIDLIYKAIINGRVRYLEGEESQIAKQIQSNLDDWTYTQPLES